MVQKMVHSPPASCSSPSSSVGFEEAPKRRGSNSNSNNKQQKQQHNPRRNLIKSHKNCKQNQSTTTTGRRSSIYRGVTRHRWTGRFEAHLWDKSAWNNIQNKKGRQVYLGAYDTEEAAAHTYDLAALKYWGKDATLNFPIETYVKDIEEMDKASKEEYLASLRRQSSGFSRGISKYRGVARHHHNGRWEARIGRVCGNKYLYLGTYKTQEEAAVAYDMAAIEYRGLNAVTNFDISNYIDKIKRKDDDDDDDDDDESPQQTEAQIETTPISPPDSEETEEETTTPSPPANLHMQQPQQQHLVQNTDHVSPSEESSLVTVMDHVLEQDLPWSFMYTTGGLPQFQQDPDLDLSQAEDFMSMLDGAGFEEDIDFLFSTEPGGGGGSCDINISAVLDSIDCVETNEGLGGSMVVDNNNKQKQQQQQLLNSLDASSPSSTTTTVSCNYSL